MKVEQVAAQLFTIRDFLKTPAAITESLEKISDIGYQAVELCALGKLKATDLLQLCDELGLVICAAHEASDRILDEPEKVVETLRALECKYTAYPYPSGIDLSSDLAVSDLISRLDHAGSILAEADLVLTYHNHQIEFRKVNDKIILDMIYEDTSTQNLQAEIDTYWVQVGGGDPAAWCSKLKDRLPLVHLKDYRINEQNEVEFAEIGSGNLNFRDIIRSAEAAGCEWFIVEQDHCHGDPFEALATSFEFIRENLCS